MEKNYYVDQSSKVINCKLKYNSKVYKSCDVRNCVISNNTSIGDFSRVANSNFAENVVLQRNSMVYNTSIGRFTYTGKNFVSWYSTIGAFCSLSWNVSIGGANHDYRRVTTHSFLYSKDFGILDDDMEPGYDRFSEPCEIGNDVWIAADVCICRGVKIGDGAVVGAGSVVTKDVPPYTIVAGVPARPIKKRFSDNICNILRKSKWWNLPVEVIKENFELFNSEPDEKIAIKILKLSEDNNK